MQTTESKLKSKDSKSKEDLKSCEKTIADMTSKVDSLEEQKNKLEALIKEVTVSGIMISQIFLSKVNLI